MRKLISLISVIAMSSTSTFMAVSCNKYDKVNTDGSSVLVNFIENLDGLDNDQKTQIDAGQVLSRILQESGAGDRQKFVNDLDNLLDTAILKHTKALLDDKSSNAKLNSDSNYNVDYLLDTLESSFKGINSQADTQITRERAQYQSDYGWKWKNKWREYLAGKFPLYQDKAKNGDIGFLEKKYKANLLLKSPDYSANTTLRRILLTTDSYGVTWSSVDDIINSAIAYQESNDKSDWFKNNNETAVSIINSQYSDVSKWVTTTTTTELDSFLGSSKTHQELSKIIKNDAPVDISKFDSSRNSTRIGMLSNSQKFFYEKWYQSKAPLAISSVKFPFAANYTFDKGIDDKSFDGQTGAEKAEINEFASNYLTSDIKKWSSIMSKPADITKTYADATASPSSTLLTLSDSSGFEQDVRTAIYKYIDDKLVGGSSVSTKNVKADDWLATNLANMKRTSSSDFSVELDNGFLAMVTSSGLMFYHIDGWDQLLASKGSEKAEAKTKFVKDGKIDDDTLKELESFKKFNEMNNDDKIATIQLGANADVANNLNKDIANPYLKYLVNNSLVSSATGSATTFNIKTSVENWATQTDSPKTDGEYEWVTFIFDYFRTLITDKDGKQLQFEDLISNYIDFKGSDYGSSITSWYVNAIKTVESIIETNPSQSYYKSYKDWTQTLDQKSDKNYPKGYITSGNFISIEKIDPTVAQYWWITSKK